MKELVVCSMFRDSMVWRNSKIRQVHRYFKQMKEQSVKPDIYALEGDSIDNTYETVSWYANNLAHITLVKCDINASRVTSDAEPKRYVELASLGNYLFQKVSGKYKYCLWLESDLIIHNTGLIESLLDLIKSDENIGACAPMIYIQNILFRDGRLRRDGELCQLPTIFYDSWGFTSEVCDFKQVTPYDRPQGIIDGGSVGSCVMFDLEFAMANNIDFGIDGCLRELCMGFRNHGKTIKIDCDKWVLHPGTAQVRGRWV